MSSERVPPAVCASTALPLMLAFRLDGLVGYHMASESIVAVGTERAIGHGTLELLPWMKPDRLIVCWRLRKYSLCGSCEY